MQHHHLLLPLPYDHLQSSAQSSCGFLIRLTALTEILRLANSGSPKTWGRVVVVCYGDNSTHGDFACCQNLHILLKHPSHLLENLARSICVFQMALAEMLRHSRIDSPPISHFIPLESSAQSSCGFLIRLTVLTEILQVARYRFPSHFTLGTE